ATIGANVPATKATVYFSAKCPSGTTSLTFNLQVSGGSVVGYPVIGTVTSSCTPSYATYAAPVDFTTYGTGHLIFGGGANTYQVAWIAIRPYMADFNGYQPAPIASPAFTGTPTAPTAAPGTNTTQLATTAFVQAAVSSGTGITLNNWVAPGTKSSSGFAFPANFTKMFSFDIGYNLSATKITYRIQTADNSTNTYDLGIYNSSGTLACHLGATAGTAFAPSANLFTATLATACMLTPGKY